MTFTAAWSISDPNDVRAGAEMTVTSSDDVDTLVTKLADPNAGAALIRHQQRPPTEFHGQQLPDHHMTAGVWHSYGYITFTDRDHEPCTLVGNPGSPMFPADAVEYDAGSGVSIETLAAALREFLATAQRPTNVEWRTV